MKQAVTKSRAHGHLMQGTVTKRSEKTIKVQISTLTKHKATAKYIKIIRSYTVHDELNESVEGDTVEFAYYRPISKTKSHLLMQVLAKKK